MLDVVLVVVLAAHLLCMNVASAGPLVCIWLEWKEARRDELAGRVGRFLAWKSVALLAVGAALGVLVGGLLWDDAYRDVLRRFPSKIHFGIWEFVFSLVLMLWHPLCWKRAPQPSPAIRLLRTLLPLLAATNLLYHFPFLFTIISDVAVGTTIVDGVVDAARFRQLMADGSVVSRVLHVWVASLAVTGAALIGWVLWQTGSETGPTPVTRAAVWGARLALVATLVQIPVGLWILATLPATAQQRLLGGDITGTALLLISVLAALWLLHLLSAVALGDTTRDKLVKILVTMTVVVVLMTGVLRRVAV